MLNKKELAIILAVAVVLAFAIDLLTSWQTFLNAFLAILLILIINTGTKKLTAFFLDAEVEVKLWEIRRLGWHPITKFKKPVPAGVFIPIISKIFLFPINGLVWMASLVFDVKSKTYRAAKQHGKYSFAEIAEYHLGLIAASGIVMNLIAAVIGYFAGFEDFARFNLYYAFFNMLPVSDLDGNKILFGNLVMWAFLASIVLIGLILAVFAI